MSRMQCLLAKVEVSDVEPGYHPRLASEILSIKYNSYSNDV